MMRGLGALHALIAGAVLAGAACARVSHPGEGPAEGDESGGDDADTAGASPGAAGPDDDAPTESAPDRPRAPTQPLPAPAVIGETAPLGEPLSFAFKAGYHDQEQIWLRGDRGGLARISTWTTEPPYTESCGVAWSTGGYIGGRFGELHLDATGEYLLFTEQLSCSGRSDQHPTRLLAHELDSGRTVVLAELTVRPSIVSESGVAAIVLVRHESRAYPPEPLAPGALDLYEFAGGALVPIELPSGDRWLTTSRDDGVLLSPFHDRLLLLVDGAPALEKVEGAWQRSGALDALAGLEVGALAASPSQSRLCATTERIAASGARERAEAWVLDGAGDWISGPFAENVWVNGCTFSPDESIVAFGSLFYRAGAEGLVAMPLLTSRTLAIAGAWRGALYGTDTGSGAIVRVDWATLDVQTALESDLLPALCAARPSLGASAYALLPPDDRPLAILKSSCGCIDCDISGSSVWHAESGSVGILEEVWGEHEVYGVAWLADGGAVVLSTQRGRSDPEQMETQARPTPGAFFHVDAAGAVQTIGPLPGVQGVLHSPIAPAGIAPALRRGAMSIPAR